VQGCGQIWAVGNGVLNGYDETCFHLMACMLL